MSTANIDTVESGNVARPVTVRSKNVNKRSNIMPFLMPFFRLFFANNNSFRRLRSFPSISAIKISKTRIPQLSARVCIYKQIFSSNHSQVHAARENSQKPVHLHYLWNFLLPMYIMTVIHLSFALILFK